MVLSSLSLAQAKAEQAYQFEREGYYCADNKDFSAEKLAFNRTVPSAGYLFRRLSRCLKHRRRQGAPATEWQGRLFSAGC